MMLDGHCSRDRNDRGGPPSDLSKSSIRVEISPIRDSILSLMFLNRPCCDADGETKRSQRPGLMRQTLSFGD